MKQLVCEMCGGNGIVKQDGMYVCQSCGTKYTLEEARKMMVEGTVDVQGTVKIDTTRKFDNLIQLARRAKEEGNAKDAQRYYDMILLEDPENWEAAFYHVYFQATECKIGEIASAAVAAGRAAMSALELLQKTDEGNINSCADEIAAALVQLSTPFINASINQFVKYQNVNGTFGEYKDRVTSTFLMLKCTADAIWKMPAVNNKLATMLYKSSMVIAKNTAHMGVYVVVNDFQSMKPTILERIREQEPEYEDPDPTKKGGCYIATAIYGSYDCPPVWTLRRYRDKVLAATWYGRMFICVYYSISPTLVRLFGKTKWFKRIWKNVLDSMVVRLQQQGFDSTPYKD